LRFLKGIKKIQKNFELFKTPCAIDAMWIPEDLFMKLPKKAREDYLYLQLFIKFADTQIGCAFSYSIGYENIDRSIIISKNNVTVLLF
jgi:hypothetical protein